ncbi:MAG: c-type cytochrome [Flavobacteriales bacterium]
MCRVLLLLVGAVLLSCGNVSSQSKENELGLQTYNTYCVACHGANGKLKLNDASDLELSTMTLEERIENVTKGGSMMPAFAEVISKEEIEAVAKYIEEFRTESK